MEEARAIQDAPNLKELPPEAVRPSCVNCAFFNGWHSNCTKYNFTTQWDFHCDSWTGKADIVEESHQGYMLALNLPNQSTVLEVKEAVAPYFNSVHYVAELVEPEDYHVTLVYYPATLYPNLDTLPAFRSFEIETGQLEVWENWDGIVLVLRIDSPELRDLQRTLYQDSASQDIPTSPHSFPDIYKPHITLAYIYPLVNPSVEGEEFYSEFNIEEFRTNLPILKSKSIAIDEYSLVSWDKVKHREMLRDINMNITIDDLPFRSIREETLEGEAYTVYDFLGMPYTGPLKGNKDLHGTRFTTTTDIGSGKHSMPVHFDHGLSNIPELRGVEIGTAYVGEETSDGRIISVFIKQRSEYAQLMADLKEMDLLRGSAQAIASLYRKDRKGNLTKFVPCEFGVTVRPSNDDNKVIEVREIIRSFIKENGMEEVEAQVIDTPETVAEVPEVKRTVRAEDVIAELRRDVVVPEVTENSLAEQVLVLTDLVRSLTLTTQEIQEDLAMFSREILVKNDEVLRKLPEKIAAQQRAMSHSEAQTRVNTASRPGRPTSGLASPLE